MKTIKQFKEELDNNTYSYVLKAQLKQTEDILKLIGKFYTQCYDCLKDIDKDKEKIKAENFRGRLDELRMLYSYIADCSETKAEQELKSKIEGEK